jgi:signal transduction histidine kinase/CheY-like chemotaxis protein
MATTMAPLHNLTVEIPRMELQGVSWEGFHEYQGSCTVMGATSNNDLRDYVWKHCQDQLMQALKVAPSHCLNEAPVLEQPRITAEMTNGNPKIQSFHDVPEAPSLTDEPPSKLCTQQQWMQEDVSMALKKLKLLEKLADAQRQYLDLEGPQPVFRSLLSALLEILGSEYGFVAEIKYDRNKRPYFNMLSLTNIAWDATTRDFYRDNIDRGIEFHNHDSLFGHVLTSGQPVISNSPGTDSRRGGPPPGHPPLHSFLGIPFIDSRTGKVNGVIGMANKPGGYSQADVDFLEPCVRTCSNLIQAYEGWTPHTSVHKVMKKVNSKTNLLEDDEEEDEEQDHEGEKCKRIQELELANIQLAQAHKRVLEQSAAQLRHFACSSHEIRTPLNCIIGLSSLLQTTELNPMQAESMQLISSSSELLLTVVNDVLDYSKLESGHVDVSIKPSNLQETLLSVVQSMELKTRDKNIRVRTEYSPYLPPVYETDRLRLQQILFNLLGNAFKFSDPDTCIDLKVQIGPPGRPSVASHATPLQVPCVIRFIVQDYGCGINPSQLQNIFKPFVQAGHDTKKLYEGTGLGLAITSRLVQALGGCVYANSKADVGSEFIVELPFTHPTFDVATLSDRLAKTTVLLVPGKNMPKDRIPILKKHFEAYQIPHLVLSSMDELDRITLRSSSPTCDQSGFGSSQSTASMLSDDSLFSTASTTPASIVLPRDHSYVCLVDESIFEREVMQRWKEQPVSSVLITFGPDYTVAETSQHHRDLLQIIPSVLMQSLADAVEEAQAIPSQVSSRRSKRDSVGKKKNKNPLEETRDKEDISILIVEDNVINQKVLRALLKKLGYTRTCVVGDGQMAVDAVEQAKYDVVLMDVQMPVMDGLEATRVIGQRQRDKIEELGDAAEPGPKIVFVTATVDQTLEDEAKELGAVGFVPKPFNLRQLDTCMTEICRSIH